MTHDPHYDPPTHDPAADQEPEDPGVECPECRGIGGYYDGGNAMPCPNCDGKGRIYREQP